MSARVQYPRKRRTGPPPRCIVIAGPNGAGKTTFARTYLTAEIGIVHFINADLIAAGLSPLAPQLAAMAAGRLVLQEIERRVQTRASFALESTLSGVTYLPRLKHLKESGFRLEIVYLRLSSSALALRRVVARVKQGGHPVPPEDVVRRFDRSWHNFETLYKPLADNWVVTDNSGARPKMLERFMTKAQSKRSTDEFAKSALRALKRAGRDARKTAKMYGTPIYVWENDRVVAKKL